MKSFLEMWKILEQTPQVAPQQQPQAQQPQAQQPQQAPQSAQQLQQQPQQKTMFGTQQNQNQNQNQQQNPPAKAIKDLLGAQYEAFVKILDNNINDSKFKAAMEYLIKNSGGKVPAPSSPKGVPCKKLRPTQNEVVLANSLKFPLEDAANARNCLFPSGPIAIAGRPIVTSNGGQYIIDGHHRWSQIYCVNPDANILALDIGDLGTDPISTLKAVQVAIAVSSGDVPFAKGGGINLFKINENTLKGYVRPRVSSNEEVKKAFIEFLNSKGTQQQEWMELFLSMLNEEEMQNFQKPGTAEYQANDPNQSNMFQQGQAFADQDVEKIAQYIWQNVQQLQRNNTPVPGAPKRNFMPQTDDAPEWKNNLAKPQVIAKAAAQAAQVATTGNQNNKTIVTSNNATQMPQNTAPVQNASVENNQPSLNEWLILSGIKLN